MNNPNPFIPQGSLLEQNKRRSRMKLAVFCVLAVSVCGLTAMLIQGCKREQSAENLPPVEPNAFAPDTNLPPVESTNPVAATPLVDTNAPVLPPVTPVTPVAPVAPVAPEAAGSEYVVVSGDTLGKIARNNHVSLKALEAANPGVVPTRLKVGQKLTIPAGSASAATGSSTGSSGGSGEIYVVKAGDNLSKIARKYGTTVKKLQAENNLATTKIRVGQKLKIPGQAVAPVAAPADMSAPAAPAVEPAATSAPAGVPGGQ